MKRLFIGLFAAIALLSMTSCKCTIERAAISNVSASHDLISAKLLNYVDKDSTLTPADKQDWKLLVEKDKKNIESLKKATE